MAPESIYIFPVIMTLGIPLWLLDYNNEARFNRDSLQRIINTSQYDLTGLATYQHKKHLGNCILTTYTLRNLAGGC